MDYSMNASASIAVPSIAGRLGTGNIGILATLLLLPLFTLWIIEAQREKKQNLEKGVVLPPGAVGLPYFIWDTLAFIRGHSRNELRFFFDQKEAKYGPIFKMSIMGNTIVLLDPPAGNKFLFGSEYKLFRKAYPKSMSDLTVKKSLLTLDEETHKVVRRQLLSRFFGPDAMIRYMGSMERNVLQHLDQHWVGKEDTGAEICTYSAITKFTFELILDLCFGLTTETNGLEIETLSQAFQVWSNGLLSWPINLPGFAFHRAIKARVVLMEVIGGLMANRRKELKAGIATPDQDLLSVLLTKPEEDSDVWTEDSIRENMLLLLYAGHDTTAATLTFAISDIAKHPDVYEKLIDEHRDIATRNKAGEPLNMEDLRSMTYTWQVVQETMRQTTILPLGYREATKDFQYKGYTIPKGTKLFWSSERTNRQAAFYENPDSFEPARFSPGVRPSPYVYMPFGAGSRICPGMEFAKMEILIFLHHLLKRFKWSLVDPNEKVIRVYMPRTKKGSPIQVSKSEAF